MYYIIAGQFARSHGSYNPNLGSEILILGGDIRSRCWPNISDSYSKMGAHTINFIEVWALPYVMQVDFKAWAPFTVLIGDFKELTPLLLYKLMVLRRGPHFIR